MLLLLFKRVNSIETAVSHFIKRKVLSAALLSNELSKQVGNLSLVFVCMVDKGEIIQCLVYEMSNSSPRLFS